MANGALFSAFLSFRVNFKLHSLSSTRAEDFLSFETVDLCCGYRFSMSVIWAKTCQTKTEQILII